MDQIVDGQKRQDHRCEKTDGTKNDRPPIDEGVDGGAGTVQPFPHGLRGEPGVHSPFDLLQFFRTAHQNHTDQETCRTSDLPHQRHGRDEDLVSDLEFVVTEKNRHEPVDIEAKEQIQQDKNRTDDQADTGDDIVPIKKGRCRNTAVDESADLFIDVYRAVQGFADPVKEARREEQQRRQYHTDDSDDQRKNFKRL